MTGKHKQPKALRLADALEHDPMPMGWYLDAAEELRRTDDHQRWCNHRS